MQREGEGVCAEWLRTRMSADDCFLNTLADPPGQRNGVTEMPQSSGVHMDGGLCGHLSWGCSPPPDRLPCSPGVNSKTTDQDAEGTW